MRISSFFYCVKQGIKGIWRHKLHSAASIATMSICVFIFGTFFLLLENVNNIVKEAESGVAITVFFEEDLEEEKIKEIGTLLEKRKEIAEMKYITADEAWTEFQGTYFEDSPELAEGFADDNPLTNSNHYEIYLSDVSMQNELVEYINTIDGVRKINQSEDVANVLENFNKLLYYVSVSITGLLIAVSIFLIFNTITVGIHSRKEELAIMKLVGATKSFSRLPFLIEGIIIGVIGTSLPLSGLYYVYDKLCIYLNNEFSLLSGFLKFIPAGELFVELTQVCLVAGVSISFLSSFIATRKHVKV